MQTAADLIQHYAAVRARLRKPPAAVRDDGISLRRGQSFGVRGDIVRIRKPLPAPATPIAHLDWMPRAVDPCRMHPTQLLLSVHPGKATVAIIKTVVANHYSIPREDLVGRDRRPSVAHPRHIAVFLAREATGLSLSKLSRLFGGRDHTTILHSIRWTEERLGDPDVIAAISTVRNALVMRR